MPAFSADAEIASLAKQVRQVVAASPGATVRARLVRAARTLRLPVRRVSGWYRGEVRRVEGQELRQIEHYVAEWRRRALLEQDYETRRAELVARAPRLVALLAPPSLRESDDQAGRVPGQRRRG